MLLKTESPQDLESGPEGQAVELPMFQRERPMFLRDKENA